MKTAILLITVLIFALALGFFQEKIKISVNYLIEQGSAIPGFDSLSSAERQQAIEERRIHAPFDYYHNHTTVNWLFRFNSHELAFMKWVITSCSLVLFALINILLLAIVQKKFQLTRAVILTYAVLVSIAFGIYAFGIAANVRDEAYAFSRKILGALQSIIPAMIIWPATGLWNSSLKHKTE